MSTADIDALIAKLPDDVRPVVEVVVAVLREQNAQLAGEVAELRRLLFGRKSERLPDARRGARKRAQDDKDPTDKEHERKAKRKTNREAREALPVIDKVIDVAPDELVCPCCGGGDLSALGEGVVSEQIEFVPAHLVRVRWTRRRYSCSCGKGLVTAAPPPQAKEGCEYGPALHAHVAVSKCADALPFYRLASRLGRGGFPVSRSTLCTLFHRAATQLEPLYKRLVEQVGEAQHVFADETPLPVLAEGGCDRGYIWTFVTDDKVVFVYSDSRSGKTPVRILGGTAGTLQTDAYSGYNAVVTPEGRVRAGCWAHVRRKFFAAIETAPRAAALVMDQIARLYDIEHRAVEQGVVGTPTHLALRRTGAVPIVDHIYASLLAERSLHPPKSPMGMAISHALRQETALRTYLSDARVGIDNNAAERALKPIALGRKNFLFAGHDDGAENLAMLQTLVGTCQRVGVNPQTYLEDVLVRVHTHPAKDIDALLPGNWAPLVESTGGSVNPS